MSTDFNKIQQLKTAWRENHSLRFLTWVMLSYITWNFIYTCWFCDSDLAAVLTRHLADMSAILARPFGIDAMVRNTTVYVDSSRMLYIGNACNGVEFFGIFLSFVMVYPVPFRHKWWFAIAGIVCIHILNSIRLGLLVVIYNRYPINFDFNHKYTFVIIIYGTLFLMWFLWAKKYRRVSYEN